MSTAVLDRPTTAPTIDAPPDAMPVSIPLPYPQRPRLSDALRLGAQCHPQGRTHIYNPHTGATCALGAIAVGLLGPGWTVDEPQMFEKRSVTTLIWEKTGIDLNRRVDLLPVCGGLRLRQAHTLCSIIISLNDGHRWTRERIADWLQTLGF